MSRFELLVAIGTLLVMLPLSALVGKYVIAWIGGIRVAFLRVLISTTAAYAITFALGTAISLAGVLTQEANGVRLLAGCGILAACHVNVSKSATGERLSPMKAVFAAVLQAIGGFAAFYLVLLAAAGIKKVLV